MIVIGGNNNKMTNQHGGNPRNGPWGMAKVIIIVTMASAGIISPFCIL